MSSADPIEGLVTEAFRRTLRAGSARVRYVMDSGPPEGRAELMHLHEGVADFETRMVKLTARMPKDPAELARLFEGASISGSLEDVGESFFDGGAHYYLADGKLHRVGGKRADPRNTMDPTWLLEAVASGFVSDARRVGPVDREVVASSHYEAVLRLSPTIAATLSRSRPKPARSARGAVPLHAWVDPSGFVVRMSWTVRRTRGGFRRVADQEIWRTTELWDFGLEPQIALPASFGRRGLFRRRAD